MLIPAKGHYEVCYEGTDNNGKPYTWPGPQVEAWDEDGTPWVVSESRNQRRLVPADIHSNYKCVRATDAPVVAAIPGGKWLYECEYLDGTSGLNQILAWLVRSDGEMFPVDTDSDGMVTETTMLSNVKRIFHPDDEPEAVTESDG